MQQPYTENAQNQSWFWWGWLSTGNCARDRCLTIQKNGIFLEITKTSPCRWNLGRQTIARIAKILENRKCRLYRERASERERER